MKWKGTLRDLRLRLHSSQTGILVWKLNQNQGDHLKNKSQNSFGFFSFLVLKYVYGCVQQNMTRSDSVGFFQTKHTHVAFPFPFSLLSSLIRQLIISLFHYMGKAPVTPCLWSTYTYFLRWKAWIYCYMGCVRCLWEKGTTHSTQYNHNEVARWCSGLEC